MADGTVLHADVLRDADVPWDEVQPVIMTVSPYVNHNGSTSDVNRSEVTGRAARTGTVPIGQVGLGHEAELRTPGRALRRG